LALIINVYDFHRNVYSSGVQYNHMTSMHT